MQKNTTFAKFKIMHMKHIILGEICELAHKGVSSVELRVFLLVEGGRRGAEPL